MKRKQVKLARSSEVHVHDMSAVPCPDDSDWLWLWLWLWPFGLRHDYWLTNECSYGVGVRNSFEPSKACE